MTYLVPDIPPLTSFRREDTIRRSRFVVSLGHTSTVEGARHFIQSVRDEFPDATHNCWAFAAGAPGRTDRIGCSDDGEPHGTAGRPMLNMLLHSGIGEICAVVTRYFGGIKLGTGGLVRAYQGMVRLGLEDVPTRMFMPPVRLEIVMEYPCVTRFRRLLQEFSGHIEEEIFAADVTFRCTLPQVNEQTFTRLLIALTDGTVLIHALESPESRQDA